MEGHYNDAAEESHRRDSVAMATQWADEEQRRRLQEAYYHELEAREEQEERRQLAQELIEQERIERIRDYEEGHDAPKREHARRASLNIIHDAFGWNRVDHREDLAELGEDEAYAVIEEEMERDYRKRLANQMILDEQQRRIQEILDEEEYERSLHQEHATHMYEQERTRAIEEHEEQGHHKQRAARRASLSFMMEAQGDLFQKNWLKQNSEHVDNTEGSATEDMFLREQESHARDEALDHAEAEYEQRQARVQAGRDADEEQERRIEATSHQDFRFHAANGMLNEIGQATAKQARRRSIANVPSFVEELEDDFEDYKDWAESVIHEQSEDLEQAARTIASLSQQVADSSATLDAKTEQLSNVEEALYHAYGDLNTLQQANANATGIANNNAEAAYEREEQLQYAMQEIGNLQNVRGEETEMMEEMLGQMQRMRTHDHDLEDRIEKTENMLESALMQLQKARRDANKERARREKLEQMLQQTQSTLSAARRRIADHDMRM